MAEGNRKLGDVDLFERCEMVRLLIEAEPLMPIPERYELLGIALWPPKHRDEIAEEDAA